MNVSFTENAWEDYLYWNALFFHPHKSVFLMFLLHFYSTVPAIFDKAAVKLPVTADQIHGIVYHERECHFSTSGFPIPSNGFLFISLINSLILLTIFLSIFCQ